MSDDESSAGRDELDENELEITNLRPRRGHMHSGDARRPRFTVRTWQRLALGLGLVLLVAALLVSSLFGVGTPWGPSSTSIPSAPPAGAFIPTETLSAALPSTPDASLAAPTALPGVTGVPALAPAPTSCGGAPPSLTAGVPPHGGWAIGRAPVLLGGFIGPSATMPLGPTATTMAYGWMAPYSLYGWPAPIGLVLNADISGGPVTLSGWDPRTGYPLWFGFVVAGEWGAPKHVVTAFVLDPIHPSVPAGGWTSSETFWYGYAFLPGAGCYTLAATWPGGAWRVTVSAGSVSVG